MRAAVHHGGRAMPRVARLLVLSVALGAGCAGYKEESAATSAIWSVHMTTNAGDVAACRLIGRVDSRDSSVGCGLTVQPTPEECLRYQVKRAGGDTLLMRGPAGEAYDCSGKAQEVTVAAASAPTPLPSTAPAPRPDPTPAPRPTPAPESAPAAATVSPSSGPQPVHLVRITDDLEFAKGCVYLGDMAPSAPCGEDRGNATGDCAARAIEAGADTIVRSGAHTQIFACKARP